APGALPTSRSSPCWRSRSDLAPCTFPPRSSCSSSRSAERGRLSSRSVSDRASQIGRATGQRMRSIRDALPLACYCVIPIYLAARLTMSSPAIQDILRGNFPKNEPLTVKGWIRTRRDSKAGISFLHVSDGSGFHPLQVVAPASLPNYATEVAKLTAGCAIEAV